VRGRPECSYSAFLNVLLDPQHRHRIDQHSPNFGRAHRRRWGESFRGSQTGRWLSSGPLRRAHRVLELFRTDPWQPTWNRLLLAFVSGHDHRRSPFIETAAKRLTLTAKNNAILRISIVASVFLASAGVGYYYLVYLPQREVQFEPQRVLERFRAAAEKRAAGAKQELSLFEHKVSDQRAAEQRVAEERQSLEKANRYQACLSRATDSYNTSRLAACNRTREKIVKDQDDCVNLGFPRNVCAMAHVIPEASPNCKLPRTVALALDAEVEVARNDCLEEDR